MTAQSIAFRETSLARTVLAVLICGLALVTCSEPPPGPTLSPGMAATFTTPIAGPTATPAPSAALIVTATVSTQTPVERTPAPTSTSTPVPTVDLGTLPTVPSTFVGVDHFLMGQPIGEGGNIYAASAYRYGSTFSGRLKPHHGHDLANAAGTPVVAVAPGMVYWAGDDSATTFGPQANFYGNLIVLQLNQAWNGRTVFALYGHLSEVSVQPGQAVNRGDVIGKVGATGIALGEHLHFEVRLDYPESYSATRNPDLWVEPVPGTGVMAGRITNTAGQYLPGVRVKMRCSDGADRFADTYWDSGLTPDEGFGENFALSNIPPGRCTLEATVGVVTLTDVVNIVPGRTAFVVLQP